MVSRAGRDAYPCPSMPEADEEAGFEVIRANSCPCSPPAATLRGAGPAPRLDSILEPILLAGVWVNQLCNRAWESCLYYSSFMWELGQVRDALACPFPSLGRWESCSCPSSAAALGGGGTPCLNKAVEQALKV